MPKNAKKSKFSKVGKANILDYADKKLEQKYAKVVKELGCRKFKCELLNKQELVASLSNGVARRGVQNGVRRVKEGVWVLIQPLSSDVYGLQEIVTVYNSKQLKQLEDEGKLAIIVEENKKEDLGFYFEGEDDNENIEINDDDFDFDDL